MGLQVQRKGGEGWLYGGPPEPEAASFPLEREERVGRGSKPENSGEHGEEPSTPSDWRSAYLGKVRGDVANGEET